MTHRQSGIGFWFGAVMATVAVATWAAAPGEAAAAGKAPARDPSAHAAGTRPHTRRVHPAKSATGSSSGSSTGTAPGTATDPGTPPAPKDIGDLLKELFGPGGLKPSMHAIYKAPPGARNPDGTWNQDALVESQRKRLEVINQTMISKLKMAETPHFLVFSDTAPAMTALFVQWCEALYRNLGAQFGLDPKTRIWDGKCTLLLFAYRTTFENFSRTFDMEFAGDCAAYFEVESRRDDDPHMVHICMPIETRPAAKLQDLFAHEGTHAFVESYRRPGRVPDWLHEGLAEYMMTVNNPASRAAKVQLAHAVERQGTTIRDLYEYGCFGYDDYVVAFTTVDFLLVAGRPKFKKFLDGLKDGLDQDTAMQAAYGFDRSSLEQRWRTYMKQFIGKVR